MLWRHGYLDGLFEKLGHTSTMDVSYGEIKCIPILNSGTDALTECFANGKSLATPSGRAYKTKDPAMVKAGAWDD